MYYKIFLGEDAVYYKLLLQELIFKSIFLDHIVITIEEECAPPWCMERLHSDTVFILKNEF